MPLLVTAQVIAGGVLLCLAVIHSILAIRHNRKKLDLSFALAAFFAAGEAVTAQLRYSAADVSQFALAIKISFGSILVFAICLVWFVRYYTEDATPWIVPAAITAGIGVLLFQFVIRPYGTLFETMSSMSWRRLAWGEIISVPIGKAHPWFWAWDLPVMACVMYTIFVGAGLWKRGPRNRAIAYTLGLSPLILFIHPYGYLINMGVLSPPHLYSFGFLGMSLVMSTSLISEVVKSASLARAVHENARRWRTLFDNVELLVVGCDRRGTLNYVNPWVERTTGFRREDLLGKDFDVLLPQEKLQEVRELYAQALRGGELIPAFEFPVLTRQGDRRIVVWSSVVLKDARNTGEEIDGVLSVGLDVTERRSAENARDQALVEVEKLKAQLERENTYLKLELQQIETSNQIIGRSDAIRYVLHKIQQVARTGATVLIEGETGAGKELVARAVHDKSDRAGLPFIRVNCAALPPSLVESELFGHERGAFTGADRIRKGRFELAEGGTIFLDEIGELSLDIQAKLLRVLQFGEYERVGGTEVRQARARIIAATNRELREAVRTGSFREDLFYRLNVFPISVPSLRDRRDDIPELVQHFVARFAARYGKAISEVSEELMKRFTELDWPGNVRELENAIERAVIMSEGRVLVWPGSLDVQSKRAHNSTTAPPATLAANERAYIEDVLARTGGQVGGKGGAAEILGMHVSTLRARMAKLGVRRP